MDIAYPNSKFILTIRDNPDQWCDSVIKFHSKLFGKGYISTKSNLENSKYVEKCWMCKNFNFTYSPPDLNNIYEKEK